MIRIRLTDITNPKEVIDYKTIEADLMVVGKWETTNVTGPKKLTLNPAKLKKSLKDGSKFVIAIIQRKNILDTYTITE